MSNTGTILENNTIPDAFNITDLFFNAVKKDPVKIAIIYKKNRISFGELEKQVTETVHYFLEKGITNGDRVLILVPMSIHLYRIVLALFKIGVTAVFIDEWVSKKRLEECCRIVQCKAMIGVFKAKVFVLFSSELKKIPIKLGVKYVINASDLNKTFPGTKKDDTALITFTTGSTGIPKAAKRTHEFLYYQFKALIEKLQPQDDDIDMPVLPIVLLVNLGTGTTSVIADFKSSKSNSLNPEKIFQQIKEHSVNRMTASPFFIKEISKYITRNKLSLPDMRNILTGGAPVFPNEAEIYCKAFPNAKTEIVYGSTEAEPISSISVKTLIKEKNNIHEQGLIVGKADNNIEVKIIKITNENISINTEAELLNMALPAKEIGEIIVKGNHVLNEYFNNEEALKRNKIFIGNTCWHRTGDSGSLDENGMLYLTGRCNMLIKINGKILSPFIYENYFQSIDGVEMGTIIMRNERLTAIIELKEKSKKPSVRNTIKEHDDQIKEIIFIKKIPRDPRHNSKIDYERLLKKL